MMRQPSAQPKRSHNEEAGSAPSSLTPVDDLFEGYIKWKATRVRSDRTIADYRRDYANWIRP
jgi:hypothetical protein